MSMDPTISALIGNIYDAAMAPEHWPNVLDRLRDRLEATAVAFGTDDSPRGDALSGHYTDTRLPGAAGTAGAALSPRR
jgi:hypothetical protein